VYAYDIILLSATVDGLQKMCDVRVEAALYLKITFICNKSVCIAFGRTYHFQVPVKIAWRNSAKYLGLALICGPCFKIDTDVIKRRYFDSGNAVLKNSVHQLDFAKIAITARELLYACASILHALLLPLFMILISEN